MKRLLQDCLDWLIVNAECTEALCNCKGNDNSKALAKRLRATIAAPIRMVSKYKVGDKDFDDLDEALSEHFKTGNSVKISEVIE